MHRAHGSSPMHFRNMILFTLAAEVSGIIMEAVRKLLERREIWRMLDTNRDSGRRAGTTLDSMLGFARKGDATVSHCRRAKLLDRTLLLAATDYNLKKQYDFRRIAIVQEIRLPLRGRRL